MIDDLKLAEAVAAEAVKQHKTYRREIRIWKFVAIASWVIAIVAVVGRFL